MHFRTNNKICDCRILMHKALNTLFALVFFSVPQYGQPLLVHKYLGTNNGLSQTINAYVYQSRKGMIWISSIDGLNRFDGQEIKVFKPIAGDPTSIAGTIIQSPFFEDLSGNIWFSTEKGVSTYLDSKGLFNNYNISPEINGNNVCYAFFLERNRYLWVSNNYNIYKFDIQSPTIPPELVIRNLPAVRFTVDTNSTGHIRKIYAAPWDLGKGFDVINFDATHQSNSRSHFDINNHVYLEGVKVTQILNESDSCVWLLANGNLIKFNTLAPNKYKIFHLPKYISAKINCIKSLNTKHILVGTTSGQILYFNKKNEEFDAEQSVQLESLKSSNNYIDNLYIDLKNNLWYSIRGSGVHYTSLKENAFKRINVSEPIKHIFEKEKGHFYLLSDKSIYVNKDYAKTVEKNISAPFSKLIRGEDNTLWRFSTEGLSKFNSITAEWEFKTCPEESMSFMDVVLLGKNNLLVGTLSGLLKINLSNFSSTLINKDLVYSLCVDKKGYIWQGGDNQIMVWELGVNEKLTLVKKIDNTYEDNCFFEDRNLDIMWVASSQGLLSINSETFDCYSITERDGMPNHYIYAVLRDGRQNLWFSTNRGIICFNPDIKPYQFRSFTTFDGLSSNEFNIASALQDSRGYLWFGSTKGVDVFHPDSIQDLGHAPQLAIVGLKIHDQEWRGDTAIEVVHRIQLPYNQNTLRLELAAMEYLDPERNKFKVLLQLDNEQTTWTDLGTQNFVTYANLKPGKYTFKFIACNAEGIWNDEKEARVLYIDIAPHWSDTWWFRTLLAALILGFVAVATALYYRYQLRAQQLQNEKIQREAERQRMELEKIVALADGQRKVAESEMKLLRSQLNPHFLFNAMNSINRYILSNEKEKASEYLGQFAQLTRSILDNSRNRTIALADELKMLHHYLSLENHRFRQQINWTFTISPDLDEEDVQVPSMLLQPFAENAILHGLAPKGGGHIAVEISEQENRLQCIIRDDGVGRQISTSLPTNEKPKHASVGMRLIAEQLDAFAGLEGQSASIAINDLKDAEGKPTGTEVIIILPLIYNV